MSRDLAGQELLARVEKLLGRDLLEVETQFHAELESANPYVTDVFAHVSRFRGKRLRPMLLLLSASATSG
ncbi:MAG: polyprenyl synthetase family protein, partial [Planctomycetaceae bacterium]